MKSMLGSKCSGRNISCAQFCHMHSGIFTCRSVDTVLYGQKWSLLKAQCKIYP